MACTVVVNDWPAASVFSVTFVIGGFGFLMSISISCAAFSLPLLALRLTLPIPVTGFTSASN